MSANLAIGIVLELVEIYRQPCVALNEERALSVGSVVARSFVELRHLCHFVAEEFNFRRAADRVNIDQTALSSTIRAPKGRLGATIIIRAPRRLQLTLAGVSLGDLADFALPCSASGGLWMSQPSISATSAMRSSGRMPRRTATSGTATTTTMRSR